MEDLLPIGFAERAVLDSRGEFLRQASVARMKRSAIRERR
jgi:hypothetical protein